MTDNIFGDRFAGYREPAWHRLGKVFMEHISAEQAARECGLDYNVIKVPLAGQIVTPFGTQLVTAPGRVMLLREPVPDDPEYRFFGIATDNYGIIQNMEIARALDRLTDRWHVETVGALGQGETIFITLDIGEVEVNGELLHEYFLVTDTRDGKTAQRWAYTPVRVVCQNTLITGLHSATISTSLQHHADIKGEFEYRVDLIDQLLKAKDTTKAAFETLAAAILKPNDLDYILKATFPDPKKPRKMRLLEENFTEDEIAALGALYDEATQSQAAYEQHLAKAKAWREGCVELFRKVNDEYPAIGNTAWAAYNAVAEFADWRDSAGAVDESAIFGARAAAKVRAFKAAYAVAQDRTA